MTAEYKQYQVQTIANAKAMAKALLSKVAFSTNCNNKRGSRINEDFYFVGHVAKNTLFLDHPLLSLLENGF